MDEILHHLRSPGMIRFPNVNTNKRSGFNHGFVSWCGRISSIHSIYIYIYIYNIYIYIIYIYILYIYIYMSYAMGGCWLILMYICYHGFLGPRDPALALVSGARGSGGRVLKVCGLGLPKPKLQLVEGQMAVALKTVLGSHWMAGEFTTYVRLL